MNDNLQNQIAQLLAGAQKAGQNAADFIIQQAPDVAQQIVAWRFWESAISAGGSLFLSACFILIAIFMFKSERAYKYTDSTSPLLGFVFAALSFVAIGYTLNYGKGAIKAHIAPKIVLIEYIRDFK